MTRLDRALVSSYRLTIVTMSLNKVVWPQFKIQVFGVAVVRNGNHKKSEFVPRGSGWTTLFACPVF